MRPTYRYRSFFWPAVLILVGLIALLVNTGQIPIDRLILLLQLWPLILIVVGLELIVRRQVRGPAGDVAAALIVVLAVVGAVAYVTIAPNPSATHSLDASAPLGDLRQASVAIDAGGATVALSGGTDLGSDLYHAHMEYSGSKPDITLDRSSGELVISQRQDNPFGIQTGNFLITLQLNTEIPWAITENTGASRDTINAAHVAVTALSLHAGASTHEITLGPPTGIVPVEVSGGASTVHIHRPSGSEASVRVSGGFNSLTADGRNMYAIGGLTYETPGFAGAADGYQIRVSGGASTVTLDTTAASS